MAKAKHLVGFIDAPVYPGTNPAVAKLTSPREHPTAKGPPKGPNSSRWRGSRATPKARALHAKAFSRKSSHPYREKPHSRAKEETVSIKSACSTVTVPGFRKQPPPLNLPQTSEPRPGAWDVTDSIERSAPNAPRRTPPARPAPRV